jgi:hypothetical protein
MALRNFSATRWSFRFGERPELALVDLPVDAGIRDWYPSYEAYETSMCKSLNGDPKAQAP